MQENRQKLLDLQQMLSGTDNIVVADRVCYYPSCHRCTKFPGFIYT